MLCPSELAAAVTAAAVALADGRTTDEINLLSAVFVQLGDTLATIAVQQGLCQAAAEKKKQCNSSGS